MCMPPEMPRGITSCRLLGAFNRACCSVDNRLSGRAERDVVQAGIDCFPIELETLQDGEVPTSKRRQNCTW